MEKYDLIGLRLIDNSVMSAFVGSPQNRPLS